MFDRRWKVDDLLLLKPRPRFGVLYWAVTLVFRRRRSVALISRDACSPLGNSWRSNSGSNTRLDPIAPVCMMRRPKADNDTITCKKRYNTNEIMMIRHGPDISSTIKSKSHSKKRYSAARTKREGRLVTYCPILDRKRQCELLSEIAEIIPQAVKVVRSPRTAMMAPSKRVQPI